MVGPLRAATRPALAGISSVMTSVMRLRLPISMPLLQLTHKVCESREGASRRAFSRMRCEGVTNSSTSFPRVACSISAVTCRLGGKLKPGRNRAFSRRCSISAARSGRCSHSAVSKPFFAIISARVVPQAPLPITPIAVMVCPSLYCIFHVLLLHPRCYIKACNSKAVLFIFRGTFMLFLWCFRLVLVHGWLEYADIGQVAVPLSVVQAVADDEAVRNLEAGIVELHGLDALPTLIEQRADAQAERPALAKHLHQVVQGLPAIDDVFDDQDMLLLHRPFQVFEDAHDAARFGAVAVAGNGHIVDLQWQVNGACQVGDEGHGSLERTQQQQVDVFVILCDLLAEFQDFGLNLLARH